ncbi:MAG: prepilin-type N-terminal cleavage/methylation domain-containing protein, partial [Planctomycetota bacterium]
MNPRAKGFTLLEVMIAMSILAVGAASILGTFVAAVRWQSMRVENNRITEVYKHARNHAAIAFNAFDETKVKPGERPLPKTIVVDLTDPSAAMRHPDPQVREAARKFEGFKYEIEFEENDFSVAGSSV